MDPVKKVIRELCRETFPPDVFREGSSRSYYDDNGYYMTFVGFQPNKLEKGTFLNVGICILMNKNDFTSYDYTIDSMHPDPRVGDFIAYDTDEQFRNDVREYVDLASRYIEEYRRFRDVAYAKEQIMKLDDWNWNPYYKAMICFLAGDEENGRENYSRWAAEPFFQRIIRNYGYPQDARELNQVYVIDMIRERRKQLHELSAFKKMKTYPEYE